MPESMPVFGQVQRRLPDPSLVAARPGVSLDTLHTPGPSPALVFVHGGLGNLWNFYPQLDRFYGHRELVAYSLAGNGRSRDRDSHTLSGHVQDLADLLTTLGIDEPILVGWSYGTALTLEYAKTHPVAGILLTGGGAYGLTPAWEWPLLKLVTTLHLYHVLPGGETLKFLAKRFMMHHATPDVVVDDLLRSNPLPRRSSAWRTVTDAFWGYDGRPGLEVIACPALVVHGPTDRVVPMKVARATAQLLPHGQFHELDGAGHVTLAEQPEAFAQLLETLITQAERR